jgi:hypothetical protein
MAEINNPQLTDHCNASLRVLGDKLTELMILTETAITEYSARNLGSIIDAAGSSNLITDGSETNGRTRVAGGDVYNFQTLLSAIVAFVDDANFPGRRDVIAKWNVNGHRRG